MTVNSFSCDSCGANVPLNELVNISTCPYCSKNFYINADWEESIKVSTKKAEKIMVDIIRDINIQEVQEKVLKSDLEAFRKVNESLAYLERIGVEINKTLIDNSKTIQEIERTVGFSYDELFKDAPLLIEWKKAKYIAKAYFVSGAIAGIIQSMQESVYSFGVGGVLLVVLVCVLGWPFILFAGQITAGLASYIAFTFALAGVPKIQQIRREKYLDNLGGRKNALDTMRIETRKRLLKENIRLSLETTLLASVISELNSLKSSANLLAKTEQFKHLSAFDTVKKIEFAMNRMQTVPIEFEVACSGFNPNDINIYLPFPEYRYQSNIDLLLQKALEHIMM